MDNEGETGSESSEVENGDREDRPAICGVTTRGGLIDPEDFPEQDLRLHIGICGAEIDGEPVLEAGLFDAVESALYFSKPHHGSHKPT